MNLAARPPLGSTARPDGTTVRRAVDAVSGQLRPGRVPTIRAWLICGVGFVVLASLFGAAITVLERFALVSAQVALRDRLRPAQEATAQLTAAYVDQETGQRGFVGTGEVLFLEPFEAGQRSAADLQARLRGYVGSDPESARLLDAVEAAGTQWQQRAALADIAARRDGPFTPETAVMRAKVGKALFDPLRQELNRLGQRINQQTQEQVVVVTKAQRGANIGTALGTLVAVLAALVTVVAVSRLTSRPLSRLVDELTEVAAGTTEQPITVQGPAELRSISAAAETMRTRLVRDAVDLAAAQHQLGAFGERERMAEDLHNRTVQRLFALGMTLSHLMSARPELAREIGPLVGETDAIAQELRSIIHPTPVGET